MDVTDLISHVHEWRNRNTEDEAELKTLHEETTSVYEANKEWVKREQLKLFVKFVSDFVQHINNSTRLMKWTLDVSMFPKDWVEEWAEKLEIPFNKKQGYLQLGDVVEVKEKEEETKKET
jgi:hypothetical protein